VKIKWLGHAAFVITAEDGTRIMTDPFGKYPDLYYEPIQEAVDIVVVTHKHGDHWGAKIKGNPKIVTGKGTTKVGGIEFKGLQTYHDTSRGSERGLNTVFCFIVDGLRICHMGDLGHQLGESEIAEIGQVDVLMIPVAGYYTIDAVTASRICDQIKPRVIIPMHYRNDKCAFPITGVDEFLKGKSGVKTLDSSEAEFKLEQLPQATEIIVLKHAL
jgi:L-ascorbate metabolism protein UlaG (beta-lactamase superfamily)